MLPHVMSHVKQQCIKKSEEVRSEVVSVMKYVKIHRMNEIEVV
jgi:hypothetical protein